MFARHEECILHRLGDFQLTPKHYCTFLNEHGAIVIAMGLIDGIELFELIYKQEIFMEGDAKKEEVFVYEYTKQDIATWASEFIAAFMYMHGLGITYRDFKPENVIITPSGHVKIVDFGFASLHNQPHDNSAHQMLGTPLYVPPEHITPKRLTTFSSKKSFDHPAGDWYSLGIVLYEAAFHEYPIENERDLSMKEIDNLIRRGFHCEKGEEWAGLCDLINGFFRLDPRERLGIAEDSEVIFRLSPFLRTARIGQLIDEVKHKLTIED
jgi:serine/threonine protein kinase